jgi:hypothetical protein
VDARGAALTTTSSLLNDQGVVVLRPSDADPSHVAAVPETAARMSDALAKNATLVVPRQVLDSGPAAWWEIAANGDTRAILGPALGGGKAEIPGVIPREPPIIERPINRPYRGPGDLAIREKKRYRPGVKEYLLVISLVTTAIVYGAYRTIPSVQLGVNRLLCDFERLYREMKRAPPFDDEGLSDPTFGPRPELQF